MMGSGGGEQAVGLGRRLVYPVRRIVHAGLELYDRHGCLCSIDCGPICALGSAGNSTLRELLVLKFHHPVYAFH